MILVTGGTGLVGSHLLLELAMAGEQVRAIYRNSNRQEAVRNVFSYYHSPEDAEKLFAGIEWVEADLLNVPALEKAFEGITYVYHCGAMVTFSPSAYRLLRKTNIEGTANIANLCIRNQVQKLCFVSSIAAFDLNLGQSEITEESHWNKELDHSMYAISKYGAETEVWRASQEGVPVVIVNPGVIIGPGFWNTGSGVMFKRIWNGLKYHFPQTTGFVGVKDVVKAMCQIMNSSMENEQFLLVSENLSFKTVLSKVAKSLGKPVPTKRLRSWMLTLGWVGELLLAIFGRNRTLTRSTARNIYSKTFYNSGKIQEALNFQFEPMNLVIEETGRYFKKDSTKKNLS